MIDYIWLVPLLPAIGVVLNGFLGPRLGRSFVSFVGCVVVLGAFVVSLLVWRELAAMPPESRIVDRVIYDWITTEIISIPVGFRVDPLSVTMILVVTGVGFLIHVYSTGYMWDDLRFARYFTYLNLFTFSMLILVLANNYLLMFVGWEGVGLCSYLLIGYYFDRWSAANAGKKAFIVNRVGDFGFLLGLFLIFWYCRGTLTFGTAQAEGVFQRISGVDPNIVAWIAALLLLGATGKSAQLPLYLWLPDAMEGPTPVSALIHAATMVTAGVYMIARSHAIYELAPQVMQLVAIVGAATALFAALVAIVQNDIKRVLAYSTVSQLGYMFLGVGVGAYTAGVFHLITHAFFKALLFLAAGSVMHSLAGQLDMRKMGGLAKHMPVTAWTFCIGWLAICGFPLLAGFYSKDAILASASGGSPTPLYLVGLGTAFLTAYYMSRLYFTTFWGPERIELGDEHHGGHDVQERDMDTSVAHDHAHDNDHAHDHGHEHDHGHGHAHAHPGHTHVHDDGSVHVHESPLSMTLPLVLLAIGSIVAGWLLNGGLKPQEATPLGSWLAPAVGEAAEHAAHGPLSEDMLIGLSVAAGLLGIAVAYGVHKQGKFYGAQRTPIGEVLAARFGYDGLLYAIFVRGGSALAQALWAFVDVVLIDGIVNGVGYLISQISAALRLLQTGYVRSYALMMLLGAVIVIGWYLTRLG